MIDSYSLVKALHILSSTILFGTGIGIAFFMWRSFFTNNIHQKLYAISNTVLADYCFTLPAVIIQPATGFYLATKAGFDWTSLWLVITYILYTIAVICWLPVVLIQIQLKNTLQQCIQHDIEPPARYYRLFRVWLLLGWPAFIALIVIFFVMVAKPL